MAQPVNFTVQRYLVADALDWLGRLHPNDEPRLRTNRRAAYRHIAEFWTNLFALIFALGVATGAVIARCVSLACAQLGPSVVCPPWQRHG